MMLTKTKHSGFALLLTLVVVSVVLAIGLSLLDTSLKQVLLSGTGKGSEISFHAAYAGAECGEYWARTSADDFVSGNNMNNKNCMGDLTWSFAPQGGNVFLTQNEIAWGSGSGARCTEIDVFVLDAEAEADNITYNFPNYGAYTCRDGRVCTVVMSRGFNRDCSDINSLGTIQREVVSQF